MQSFSDSRRFRITVGTTGIPAILWIVLVAGSTITVIFTYFFTFENLAVHVTMTVLLSFILSLNIVVVMILGHPYSGDFRIRPAQFNRIWPKAAEEQGDDPDPSEDKRLPRIDPKARLDADKPKAPTAEQSAPPAIPAGSGQSR